MQTFLLQLSAGLGNGGIYASMALALVMIYQSTHQLNFAQGEMAMFSTFMAWALMQSGLGFWSALALAVGVSFVLGMAIERLVLRPLRNRPHLSLVAVFVGLLLICNGLAGWIWGFDVRAFPSPFPEDVVLLGGFVSAHQVGSMVVTLVLVLALYAFFRFTPLGLAMRAAAQNPVSSRLVGVRVDLMISLGWGLASAIGAVAGAMVAHVLFLEPNMMASVLLYGFAAALVGGINNPWGAVAGGFLLGVVENMLGAYVIGDELKLTLALVIIVVVLTFMPAGLFGQRVVRRV